MERRAESRGAESRGAESRGAESRGAGRIQKSTSYLSLCLGFSAPPQGDFSFSERNVCGPSPSSGFIKQHASRRCPVNLTEGVELEDAQP